MIGILFGFLSTNQCGGSTTMMTVGNVEIPKEAFMNVLKLDTQ